MDDAGSGGRFLVADEVEAFETRYGDVGPSVAVVRAIATVEGLPPSDVDLSLHDHVDPDALDELFGASAPSGRDGDLTVEFPVGDYLVSVDADGSVLITGVEGGR